ncbi:Hypothetical protein SMAX5B_009586 [Scophthalmus maximus]|uniref:Uncharacterized protein n=1 Tax=Scophthalmus maximus TaxID=52904 RepID=A0A2U9CKS8_SCOMX|nr:Hypothetical protein SMAX5B_009586 [Scophthalmus maximus]
MDVGKKQALQLVCALMCSERRKRKRPRVWVKEWRAARGQQGLGVLQRELETHDGAGFRELLRMTAEEFDVLLGKVYCIKTVALGINVGQLDAASP